MYNLVDPLVEDLVITYPAQVQQVHHEQVGEIDQHREDAARKREPQHRKRSGNPDNRYDYFFKCHCP